MKRTIILAAFAATALTANANATLSLSGGVGGAPVGATKENFDTLAPGTTTTTTLPSGVVISFMPNAMAVQGRLVNVYAPPFLSGGNGLGFGPGGTNQPNGPDTTTYITTGSTTATPGAAVTLTFPALEAHFGILWGSVDAYNTLSFYNGAALVGALTGADVLASPSGNQGANGTLYVNINSTLAFDRVVATSSQFAFEFDNIAFNPRNPVPEPSTLAIAGMGLLGLGLARRRAK